MFKKKLTYIIIFMLLIILPFGYSFFNPWKVKFLDNIRLIVQSKIMTTAWDYTTDDLLLNINNDHQKSINALNAQELNKYTIKLKPWDIFFTDSEKYISSEFIPGKRKHSIIYLWTQKQITELFKNEPEILQIFKPHFKNNTEKLILDTNSEWVDIRDFSELSNLNKISLLVSISSFRINKDEETIKDFIKYSLSQIGKAYDFDRVTKDSSTLYCSELIYKGLEQIWIQVSIKYHALNREIISPANIVQYITQYWINKEEFKLMFFVEKENWNIIERELSEFNIQD
jgi:hypothetical protein